MPTKHPIKIILAILLISTFSLWSCTSQPSKKDSKPSAPKESWPAQMQALAQVLSELMPLAVNKARFNDKANFEKIEQSTIKLRELTHSLHNDTAAPTADPSMKLVTGLFEEDVTRALESLKAGNRDYARYVLKDTTSYCFQCHTQTDNGPSFPSLQLTINTDELSPLDRADFYVSTRQFNKAIEVLNKVVADEKLAKDLPFRWEQAVRAALAVHVRVQKNPQDTIEFLNIVSKNKNIPQFMKNSLDGWKTSAKEWKREKKPLLPSPQETLRYAENLIKRAQTRQKFPLDQTQDILYFRASAVLHDLLARRNQVDEIYVRTLYFAGLASEATRDMNFWTLHERYYEMCIRQLPTSPTAVDCFKRLQESTTLGYSGSSGVHIPPDVLKRLQGLNKILMDNQPASANDK